MRCITGLTFVGMMAGIGAAAAAQPAVNVDGDSITRICLTPSQRQRAMEDFAAAERMTIMTCLQREAARQLNTQLPRQLDEITVLHLVTSEGARLTYFAKLAVDAAKISADQRATLIQNTRNFVCSKADMRQTISYGGAYGYVWIDSNDVEIARTVVEGC